MEITPIKLMLGDTAALKAETDFFYRRPLMSFSMDIGVVAEPYLFTTCPSLLIRNLVKFLQQTNADKQSRGKFLEGNHYGFERQAILLYV